MKFKHFVSTFCVIFCLVFIFQNVLAQASVQIVRCQIVSRCSKGTTKPVECELDSDDPCRCEDSENVVITSTGQVLMHDVLVITGSGTALEIGEFVLISTFFSVPDNFLTDSGTPILCSEIEKFNLNLPPYDTDGVGPPLPGEPTFCAPGEPIEGLCDYLSTAGCEDIGGGNIREDEFVIGPAAFNPESGEVEIRIPFWREFGTTLGISLVPEGGSFSDIQNFTFPCEITSCDGPDFTTEFIPDEIFPEETSMLTYTATRPGGGDGWQGDIPFNITNTLPVEVFISATPNPSSSCGGIATANPGGTMVTLEGALMPTGTNTCTFTVEVTSDAIGMHDNLSVLSSGLDEISQPPDPMLNDHGPAFAVGPVQSNTILTVLRPIPTLGQWGMIILSLSFFVLGFVAIRSYKLVV